MISAPQKIDFRVSRDVGQVYNTAFRFIRQNKGILFKSITYYIMPFILVAAFLIFNGISEFIIIAVKGFEGNWLPFGLSLLQGIAGGLMCYVAYTAYITLIYEYMRLYHEAEKPETITHRQVWKATRKRFFMGLVNVLVWGIVMFLISTAFSFLLYFVLMIGMIFAVALSSPWIIAIFYVLFYVLYYGVMFYLQSVTFPMVFISAFDRIDVFSAFGRSFTMVNRKGNIFSAIGATFLGAVILWILHINMTSLPIGIITGFFIYNGISPQTLFDTESTWFLVLFKVVLPLFTLVYFYTLSIYFITQAFEVLSLDERIHGKGLLAKIHKLGTRKDIGPEFYDVSY